MHNTVAILLAMILGLASMPALAADSVFVIRHMQKASGDNPPLSSDGVSNAERLAALLKPVKLSAIFATKTLRAEQTAAPVARQAGLAVQHYDPRDPKGLAARVAAIPGAVLVVGHSNTVPSLVSAFGAAEPAPLGEQDYGSLFIVQAGSDRAIEISVPER